MLTKQNVHIQVIVKNNSTDWEYMCYRQANAIHVV